MNTFHRFLSSLSVKVIALCAASAMLAPSLAFADAYMKVSTTKALTITSLNGTTGITLSATAGDLASTSTSGTSSSVNYTASEDAGDVTITASQGAGTHSATDYCAKEVTFTIHVVSAVTVGTAPTNQSIAYGASAPTLSTLGSGGSGYYTYQWYTCNSDGTGAVAATGTGNNTKDYSGATVSSVGTTYYKCVITDANLSSNTVTTGVVSITVDCVNATITQSNISVAANGKYQLAPTSNSSGAFSYALTTSNGKASVNASSGLVTGSNNGTGSETVRISQAANGNYCLTTKDVTVTVTAAEAEKILEGTTATLTVSSDNKTSNSVTVSATNGSVTPTTASDGDDVTYTAGSTAGSSVVTFTQTGNATYCTTSATFEFNVIKLISVSGAADAKIDVETSHSLSVSATGGSGSYSYQWYSNDAANYETPTPIVGATSATYALPSSVTDNIGTYYYFCVVSESNGAYPVQADTSRVATIEVRTAYPKICYSVTLTMTSNTAGTLTGATSGRVFGTVVGDINLSSTNTTCDDKKGYKIDNSKYVGIQGRFLAGDTVIMEGKSPDIAASLFKISSGRNTTYISDSPIGGKPATAICGPFKFVLTSASSGIYFYRGSSSGEGAQNPHVASITVKRCCDSVGVADVTKETAVSCGSTTTFSPSIEGATTYEWYTCTDPADSIGTKSVIGGATSSSYTTSAVTSLTNYFLIAYNAGGCADTSNVATVAPSNGSISVTLNGSDPITDGMRDTVDLGSLSVGYSAQSKDFVISNAAPSVTTLTLSSIVHTAATDGINSTTLKTAGGAAPSCGSLSGGEDCTLKLNIPAGFAAGTYYGMVAITDGTSAPCTQTDTVVYKFTVSVPVNILFTGACLAPLGNDANASVTVGGNTISGTDASGIITIPAAPDAELEVTASVSGKAFNWWDLSEHSSSNPYTISVGTSEVDVVVNFTDSRAPVVALSCADSAASWVYPVANAVYGALSDVKLNALSTQSKVDSIKAIRLDYGSSRYLTYSSQDGVGLGSLSIKSRLRKYDSNYGGKGVHLYVQPYSNATATTTLGDPIDARWLELGNPDIWSDSLQTVELPGGTLAVKLYFNNAYSGDSKYQGFISYVSFSKGGAETPMATSHITPKNGTTDVDTTSSIVVSLANTPYWTDGAGNYTAATIDNVTSHIQIKRYNGSEYVVATTEFTSTATAYDADSDGNNDSIRVVYAPRTPTPGSMYGGTRYKVEISDLVNCEGEEVTDSISSLFDTEEPPVPVIGVFNANKSSVADASVSFGTIFHKASGATVTKVYGITNVGTGVLRIDSVALSGYYKGGSTDYYRITKVQYNSETPIYNNASGKRNEGTGSPTNLYSKTLSASDTLYVSVSFFDLPAGGTIGNYLDTLRVFANVSGGLPEVASRSVRFTTSVGGFVLPYTYQSGLANPVISATELKQDYATTGDVPSEIILPTAGISGLVPEYNVYSSEGACALNGQSALRVGSNNAGHNDYSLKIRLDHSTNGNITGKIGTLTIGWSAAGSRKLLITSEDGATEYYATGWLSGRRCYTHSVDIHNCTTAAETGSTSIRVQLFAADTSALSTINYINITPCDPEYISSKCDIIDLTASCTDGSFQKADSMIVLRADTTAASACGLCSGATYTGTTLTATHIDVSPGATVSPAEGTPVSINAEGYYVYTVTAEDGFTSKNFYVSVQCPVSGEGGACYGDTITYSINMDKDDKTLHVLYAGEGNGSGDVTCLVPVANAVNSTYTIHYLTEDDKPDAYVISGPTSLCVGSTGEYRLSNAPESNNPKYSWTIGVLAATPAVNSFSIANADSTSHYSPISKAYNADSLWYYYTGEVLRLQSPTVIAEGTVKVDLKINLGFEDEKCEVITGRAELNVFASMLPPTSVKRITADCKLANGNLEIRAIKPTVGDSLVVVDAKNTYPVISATSYGFDFVVNGDGEEGDLLERSMFVSDTMVTVSLAKTSPNLDVVVLAKNGCGTIPSDTLEVSYGSLATTWTGAVDSDWDDRDNWTAQVPKACTDAYIPQLDTTGVDVNDIAYTVENYPVVSADAECDSIIFLPGGGAKGLQNLSYNRAIVQQTFDRDRWYTMTAPLHQMYTGDYYYTGRPSTNLKFYNTANPDNNKNYNLQFTAGIVGLNYDLYPGNGFAYRVDTFSYVGKLKKSSSRTPQSVSLPRSTESGILVPSYYKFSTITGGALGSPYAVTRTGNLPYRLAFDQNETTGAADFDPIDTTLAAAGYHLIGNPLMTHLNFAAWQGVSGHGSNVDATMWIWNNHYNSTTSVVTGEALPLGASAAANKVVPPAQAFFVHTTANNKALRFDPTQSYFYAPASGTANIHMRADESKNTLYIVADDGKTKSFASLRNSELANNDFVRDEDAEKLFSAHTLSEIYTLTNGHAVDINQFNADNIDIPVGVRNSGQKAEEATTHLTFDGAESFENQSVYLLNTLTGDSVDLKLQNTYEFKYDSAHQEGALYLVFRSAEQVDPDPTDPNAPTDVEEVADNSGVQITVHGGNTVRVISSLSDPIREIDIFSASGARIVKLTDVNASTRDVQLNAGQRTVVVRAVTDNTVTTKEVLIY